MNIFELLTLIACLVCAALLANYLGSRFGMIGWIGGGAVGFAVPIVGLWLVLIAANKIDSRDGK